VVDELPALRALAAALPDEVRLLGLSWDAFESGGATEALAAEVGAFGQRHQVDWPSLLVGAEPEAFFLAFDITWQKIPQTWLVDDAGQVLWREEGMIGPEQVPALAARIAAARASRP
jgi:hypothetical protein